MGHWALDMDRDMGRDMEAPSFPFLPSTETALQLEPGRERRGLPHHHRRPTHQYLDSQILSTKETIKTEQPYPARR